jgi:hypothetical protein
VESLEYLLFSGNYDAVIAQTASRSDPEARLALIGALALSGRLDEAESAFRGLEGSGADEPTITQARFFVIAGLCHAGNVQKAMRLARASLGDLRRPKDRSRFWLWQGLALVRFFEGRLRRARGFARRALAAAVEASFPYARVLALDLLAHVLLYTGQVFAGMRLLGQAAALAESLGYADNTATLRTSAVLFQLRFLLLDVERGVADAETALASPAVSYFTRRNVLIELAAALAFAGDVARARTALDEAQRIALPGSDRRGKARWLTAHALVTALSEGPTAARASLDQARSEAGEQITLLADIGIVEVLFVAPAHAPELERVARETGIARALVVSALACGGEVPPAPRVEDRLARLLIECHRRSAAERVAAVVRAGLLGLVPWALGLPPGRRVLLTDAEVVTENRGAVSARPLPGGPSQRLLASLAQGFQSREDLVSLVWGLGRYNPSKHNAVINTAVSRLRLALGEPAWVVTHEGGYLLADGVEIVSLEAGAANVASPSSRPPPDPERDRVLAVLEAHGPSGSAEVARRLRMSPSTALRLLRRLADDGTLVRQGAGRSTRYGLRGE